MHIESPLVEIKNQWLHNQVDCEFPTKESLEGLALYQRSLSERTLLPLSCSAGRSSDELEHFLVDFHRLTILFSIMQSKRWTSEAEQALIVEFLTQIILAPEHALYVSFSAGEPVGAAMLTYGDDQLLVSDVIYRDKTRLEEIEKYVADLIATVQKESPVPTPILLEV
ncbi:hypothetical protein BOO92_12740 [Vibrio navarrensis]|uniref:Flavodoxin n=1 Tax=Vibrio navarrensis TaxID=29495 RepID=A0AAJ4IG51_9VIBR|nr:hypothetical protein [Vibrio navarrensis]MBE3657544.1 hypothetical protein [Vibrio navarrensis]QPL55969.1 hypothetical protein I3X05_17765 [Vibrio navarrensis]